MFSMRGRKGYALLTAIIAVNIFAILSLVARSMWETQIQRDLEAELLFRAGQYRTGIELYLAKNTNLYPKDFDVLFEKKFLRQLYEDPMSEDGKWNIVMRSGAAGKKSELLIVPEDMLPQYTSRAMIVGVCSSSPEEGFREYRGKKRYSEWAVYVGEQVDKEMPELKFVTEGNKGDSTTSGTDSSRDSRDSRGAIGSEKRE